MTTLANPYHALMALLRTRWQRHRARQQTRHQAQWGLDYIRDRYGSR